MRPASILVLAAGILSSLLLLVGFLASGLLALVSVVQKNACCSVLAGRDHFLLCVNSFRTYLFCCFPNSISSAFFSNKHLAVIYTIFVVLYSAYTFKLYFIIISLFHRCFLKSIAMLFFLLWIVWGSVFNFRMYDTVLQILLIVLWPSTGQFSWVFHLYLNNISLFIGHSVLYSLSLLYFFFLFCVVLVWYQMWIFL